MKNQQEMVFEQFCINSNNRYDIDIGINNIIIITIMILHR